MTDHLEGEALKSSDEAWLVVDKDQWTEEQLTQLHQWSLQRELRLRSQQPQVRVLAAIAL